MEIKNQKKKKKKKNKMQVEKNQEEKQLILGEWSLPLRAKSQLEQTEIQLKKQDLQSEAILPQTYKTKEILIVENSEAIQQKQNFKKQFININKEIWKYKSQQKEQNVKSTKRQHKKYKAIVDDEKQSELKRKTKKPSKIRQIMRKYKLFKEEKLLSLQKQYKNKTNQKKYNNKQDLENEYITVEEYSQDEEKKVDVQQNLEEFTKQNNIGLSQQVKFQQFCQNPQKIYHNMIIRNWVNHVVCEEIDEKIMILINKLSYQQAMKQIKEPLKFKKRIVAGFKECQRSLDSNILQKSCQALILAINIEENPLKQGSDDIVLKLLNSAQEKQIPIIHSSSRKKLGSAFTGKVFAPKIPKISAISIINYHGFEDLFNEIIFLWNEKKNAYQNLLQNL